MCPGRRVSGGRGIALLEAFVPAVVWWALRERSATRSDHDGIDHFPYGPDFDAAPGLREPLFFDIGHPDAEGYRVYAAAVSAALEPLLP